MASKNKNAKRRLRPDVYVMAVRSWAPDYLFVLNDPKRRNEGAYAEHAHLVLKGTFIHPAGLSASRGRLRLVGERELTAKMGEHSTALRALPGIGGIEEYHDGLEVTVAMPYDALWGLCAALGADRLRFAVFEASPMLQHEATVYTIGLCGRVDYDLLVAEP